MNEIRTIRMQILTIRKAFKAFKCKFELFEQDSTHWKANSNHLKGIRDIRMQIWTFWAKFEAFECNLNSHKQFEPFEWKF